MDMKPFLLKNFIIVATGEIGWKKYTSTETIKAFAEHNGLTVTKAQTLAYKVAHRARLFNGFKNYGLQQSIFKTQVYYYSCEIDIPLSEQNLIANAICRNYSTAEEFLAGTPDEFIKCRGVGKKYAEYMTLVQDKIRNAGYTTPIKKPKDILSRVPSVSFMTHVVECKHLTTGCDEYLDCSVKAILDMIKFKLKAGHFFTVHEIRGVFNCRDNPRTRQSLTFGYDENDAANIEDLIQYEIIDGIVHVDLYSIRNLCMEAKN